jgi:predicted P-loop ATPase
MLKFTKLKGKVRTSSKTYAWDDIPQSMFQGQIGLMMPTDMVVLDVDSEDERSKYYIEWVVNKFKGIFITKTNKAGGYHIYFKTNRNIKAMVGMQTVFGFTVDIKRGINNYITLPDNFDGRKYLTRFKDIEDLAVGWDDYNVMLPENLDDVCPFLDTDVSAHVSPMGLEEHERNSGLIEWLGFFVAKGVPVDKIKQYDCVFSKITGLSTNEINNTVLSSLAKYSGALPTLRQTSGIKVIEKFIGDDYVDISLQLKNYLKENDMAGFDEATGLGFVKVGNSNYNNLTLKQMKTKLSLYFGDKIFLKVSEASGRIKLTKVPTADRDPIFEEVIENIRYNSREQIYQDIPKWDGIERIKYFMKNYFLCDTNPNLFWLFMTSLVGMIKNPYEVYCPYFFDFVSEAKGVGKTLLLKKISNGWFVFMSKGRSIDDLYVNAYSQNALIAIDDECFISDPDNGKGVSYDFWKQFVTADKDVFSRKNMQPEMHRRSFIVCRTSNKVKTGYATDERRQIIFESTLGKEDCRILDLPNTFFAQLLAEAKVYFEKNGVYKLTDEDRRSIELQQLRYFNSEKNSYIDIKEYVDWARVKAQSGYQDDKARDCLLKSDKITTGVGINWRTYRNYCMYCGKPMSQVWTSMTFWNCISAIAAKTGACSKQQMQPLMFKDEWEKYAVLYVNDEDVVVPDITEAKPIVASVKSFFDDKPKCNDEDIKELEPKQLDRATVDANSYLLPKMLDYCPKSVRDFFEKYQHNAGMMVPTTINVADGLDITYGLGGAHYAKKGVDETDIMFVDVNSMYPNIMVGYNLLSRAITKPSVYVGWLEQRLEAKANGDIDLSNQLKLKINSVYGKMKQQTSVLYDPEYGNSIAVTGQVLITILALGLYNVGCEILNINTDGIMFKPNGEWQPLCDKWCQRTNMKLSTTKYKQLFQLDVNNYKAVCEDGKIITKGAKFK